MQTKLNGRIYQITSNETAPVNLRNQLLKNGWDGNVYLGTSAPVGRQRKPLQAQFFRSAKTGKFASVL